MKRGTILLQALLWTLVLTVIVGCGVTLFVERYYGTSIGDEGFRFERPWAALLLLGAPLAFIARAWLHRYAVPRLQMSRTKALREQNQTWRNRLSMLPAAFAVVSIALLAIALMGPQSIHARDRAEVNGIEIIITMDMSGSMQAADIEPTRFEATQFVVQDFIMRRPDDRIGAVVFARDAYTLLPLTTDRQALQTALAELSLDQIDPKGTAIGNAIGVSLNRLKRSQAKSKVVILLTDGDSNAGNVSPLQAATLAQTMGVKIFPILMGVSDEVKVKQSTGIFGGTVWGQANMPVNPELLQKIADETKGQFFPVTDRQGLSEVFTRFSTHWRKPTSKTSGGCIPNSSQRLHGRLGFCCSEVFGCEARSFGGGHELALAFYLMAVAGSSLMWAGRIVGVEATLAHNPNCWR